MPRVKWIREKEPETPSQVKQDYISMMFGEYMRQRKITYEMLGEKLDKPPGSLRVKKCKGSGKYQMNEIFDWCAAMDVDADTFGQTCKYAYIAYRQGK